MRTIALSLVIIAASFIQICSQTTPASTQDDLCTAINKLMQIGVKDGFESIKTGERKSIPSKVYTDYYFESTYAVAGFTDQRIKKTITGLSFYTTNYFRGQDANEGVVKYKELIEKVKLCLPTANCTFSESQGVDNVDMKRYEFWTLKAKAGQDPKLEKYFVSVNYVVDANTKDAIVYLKVSLKE